MRWRQWWYFTPLPLAGWRADHHPLDRRWMAALVAAAGALGFAYGLNALCDREADLDARKNPLVGVASVPVGFRVGLVVLVAWALAWAQGAGGCSLRACALSLCFGWAYSAGPRLKRWAVVGSLCNLGIFVPLMWLGPHGDATARDVLATVFGGALLQNQLLHEQADDAEDRRAGVHTTAHWLGARRSTWLGVVLIWLGAALAGLGSRWSGAHGPAVWLIGLVACAGTVSVALPERTPAQHRQLHRTFTGWAGALLWLGTVVERGRG
jgi:4-hydroxybenzoate polyprenyltransferase